MSTNEPTAQMEAAAQIARAVEAANGDSNDEEIERLWDAVRMLADIAGIPVPEYQEGLENPCNCEATMCPHPHMSVPAGLSRAMYVGPICDECAKTHMAEYLV